MAQKCVSWVSSTKLPCYASFPADVVLCVTASKVQPPDCAELEDTSENYTYHSIDAILTDVVVVNCNCTLYQYTFCYDDTQIVVGQTILSSDISGVVCKDCLTQWVEDKVGGEVKLIENEDGSLTLVTQHGCEYTFWPGETPT